MEEPPPCALPIASSPVVDVSLLPSLLPPPPDSRPTVPKLNSPPPPRPIAYASARFRLTYEISAARHHPRTGTEAEPANRHPISATPLAGFGTGSASAASILGGFRPLGITFAAHLVAPPSQTVPTEDRPKPPSWKAAPNLPGADMAFEEKTKDLRVYLPIARVDASLKVKLRDLFVP